MISFLKRVPAAAWFGCWLLSMVGLGSYGLWDTLVVLMLAIGLFWYGTTARTKLLLALIGVIGYSAAFMFSGAAYAALALALAGCAAASVTERVTWFKSLSMLFIFLVASIGIAYTTFSRPQSAAFWFMAFLFAAWFLLDSLIRESGAAPSKGVTALGALLVSQISLLVLFLPLGYFAQAFCMTMGVWLVEQGIELIEKRVKLKEFLPPLLVSSAAVWLMIAVSFVASH